MSDIPVTMTAQGAIPTPPATLRATLLALVAATNPGYTANLPGSLIEDIASTDVGALSLIDSARVELINSLTPFGANDFVLNQLGAIYGVAQGVDTNTSVLVQFTGTPGFVIAKGFVISDGTNQYALEDGGIVGSGGMTTLLFALATNPGSFAVPANTVTQLVTSIPSVVTLTVTNPQDGIPSPGPQTEADYRAQVLQAGLAASQGMSRYLKTILNGVLGVQDRLVSVRQQTGGGWEVIVGGGDPYQVAYAIYTALFDVSTLVGSQINVTGATNANPGVYTTDLNHGLVDGQTGVTVSGSLNTSFNHTGTVHVITEKTFSFSGFDTTSFGAYTSGGIVTPNSRNITVSIIDYPDTYELPYVLPPQQDVEVTLTWNTTATNAVDPVAIAAAGTVALATYVNSIAVGQPINLFELQTTFQQAVSELIPPQLLTRMVFAVNINGVGVSPISGTGIISGDPESYFQTDPTQIIITQG